MFYIFFTLFLYAYSRCCLLSVSSILDDDWTPSELYWVDLSLIETLGVIWGTEVEPWPSIINESRNLSTRETFVEAQSHSQNDFDFFFLFKRKHLNTGQFHFYCHILAIYQIPIPFGSLHVHIVFKPPRSASARDSSACVVSHVHSCRWRSWSGQGKPANQRTSNAH